MKSYEVHSEMKKIAEVLRAETEIFSAFADNDVPITFEQFLLLEMIRETRECKEAARLAWKALVKLTKESVSDE